MKIKAFEIKNFLSWEKGYFELSPNVNIFSGVSDKGKSSILCGFEWFRTNRFAEKIGLWSEFASDWIKKEKKNGDLELTGECSFRVILDDDSWAERVIGPSINEYRMSSLKDPLKAIGTSVPDEIAAFLNMSDINIQNQANPHFLIGDSPPDIGRKLNQIASLSDIDTAFKNADSEIRQLNADIKRSNAEILSCELQLENYDWIDSAENDLRELEILSSQASVLRNDEHQLRTIKDKIDSLQLEIGKYKEFISAQKEIEKIETLNREYQVLDSELSLLIDIEEKIADCKDEIDQANKVINAQKEIDNISKQQDQIDDLKKEIDALVDFENKIIDAKEQLESATKEYNLLHSEYEKNTPDNCPFCGVEIK